MNIQLCRFTFFGKKHGQSVAKKLIGNSDVFIFLSSYQLNYARGDIRCFHLFEDTKISKIITSTSNKLSFLILWCPKLILIKKDLNDFRNKTNFDCRKV